MPLGDSGTEGRVNRTGVLRYRMRTEGWRIDAGGHEGRMEIACLGVTAAVAIVGVLGFVSFGRAWMPGREVLVCMQ